MAEQVWRSFNSSCRYSLIQSHSSAQCHKFGQKPCVADVLEGQHLVCGKLHAPNPIPSMADLRVYEEVSIKRSASGLSLAANVCHKREAQEIYRVS